MYFFLLHFSLSIFFHICILIKNKMKIGYQLNIITLIYYEPRENVIKK